MKSFIYIPYEFPRTKDGKFIIMQEERQMILARREQLGLSQEQVAELAHVTQKQYQRIETGEQSIAGSSMRIGMSVCAALLLDPLPFLGLHVDQPDPATLKPQYVDDIDIPPQLYDPNMRRPGRRSVRRGIPRVYLNGPDFSILIPAEVFSKLGPTPEYIEVRVNWEMQRFAILVADETSEEKLSVIDYQTVDGDLILFGTNIKTLLRKNLGWKKHLYEAEAWPVKNDADGKRGLIIELSTAKLSDAPTHEIKSSELE